MDSRWDKPEIAFFDLETNFPHTTAQRREILEFGAILICPRRLIELKEYSTFVRPSDSIISDFVDQRSGITRDDLLSAPTFAQVAGQVYDILHGRIWAGHNIKSFDSVRIREAFAEINMQPPEPKGMIDSLALLPKRFEWRAGNKKMKTLADYFGLGPQEHRCLDDIRMNVEVLKCFATVSFLESSLLDILDGGHPLLPFASRGLDGNMADMAGPSIARTRPYYIMPPSEMDSDSLQSDGDMEEDELELEPEDFIVTFALEGSSDNLHFLVPNEISIPSISAAFRRYPFYNILHGNKELHICCKDLKVRYGFNPKYTDSSGHPRLTLVVVCESPILRRILEAIDNVARNVFENAGSRSKFWPSVIRNVGLFTYDIRLLIPSTADDDSLQRCETEIWFEESGSRKRILSGEFYPEDLKSLFKPGDSLDAYFSVGAYDYKNKNAGIRLVAKMLIKHAKISN